MKINIVGSILGTTGYDSHTRQLVNALYELNPDIKLDVPLTPDYLRNVNDAELNMITKENRKADVIISITTPPFWRMAMSNSKHFVGFCVWEGDKIPEYWLEYLLDDRVNQIWVPSKHTKQAIWNTYWKGDEREKMSFDNPKVSAKMFYEDKKFWDKIKIVPHGVNTDIFQPRQVKRKNKFTFVCNKGWRGGWEDRGGVAYVLKAFCEEFKKDEKVELMLKLNPSYIQPDKIGVELEKLNLTKDRPIIKINCDNLPYKKLVDVYSEGDVYVCAQKADAFNIPGLEAMACGLPTIQTGFGGQTEYMTPKNGWVIDYKLENVKGDIQYEEVKWAIPKVDDLRSIMRWCFENQEKVKYRGKQALEDVKKWTWRESAKKAISFLNEL